MGLESKTGLNWAWWTQSGGRGGWVSEFEIRLVYIASSRPGYIDTVSKTKKC